MYMPKIPNVLYGFEHLVKDKITPKQLKYYDILPDRWYNKDKIYFHKKLRITAKIGYLLSQFPTTFLLQYAKKYEWPCKKTLLKQPGALDFLFLIWRMFMFLRMGGVGHSL